jgi:hypothetical protein
VPVLSNRARTEEDFHSSSTALRMSRFCVAQTLFTSRRNLGPGLARDAAGPDPAPAQPAAAQMRGQVQDIAAQPAAVGCSREKADIARQCAEIADMVGDAFHPSATARRASARGEHWVADSASTSWQYAVAWPAVVSPAIVSARWTLRLPGPPRSASSMTAVLVSERDFEMEDALAVTAEAEMRAR